MVRKRRRKGLVCDSITQLMALSKQPFFHSSICLLRFDDEFLKPDIYLMKVTTEVEMCA